MSHLSALPHIGLKEFQEEKLPAIRDVVGDMIDQETLKKSHNDLEKALHAVISEYELFLQSEFTQEPLGYPQFGSGHPVIDDSNRFDPSVGHDKDGFDRGYEGGSERSFGSIYDEASPGHDSISAGKPFLASTKKNQKQSQLKESKTVSANAHNIFSIQKCLPQEHRNKKPNGRVSSRLHNITASQTALVHHAHSSRETNRKFYERTSNAVSLSKHIKYTKDPKIQIKQNNYSETNNSDCERILLVLEQLKIFKQQLKDYFPPHKKIIRNGNISNNSYSEMSSLPQDVTSRKRVIREIEEAKEIFISRSNQCLEALRAEKKKNRLLEKELQKYKDGDRGGDRRDGGVDITSGDWRADQKDQFSRDGQSRNENYSRGGFSDRESYRPRSNCDNIDYGRYDRFERNGDRNDFSFRNDKDFGRDQDRRNNDRGYGFSDRGKCNAGIYFG